MDFAEKMQKYGLGLFGLGRGPLSATFEYEKETSVSIKDV
jgi:anti-sigma regulatory factor (Ser/Thr protein kinase)